ncbi:MAG: hypothetical protein FD181_2251 [Prolixibacteraceae bacterium]|nr:MAG: hypothetical protein FD181_2251 [Prolixibacteraceae bacterium]
MKERDNIEELILNNLKDLNDLEPRDGHFDRFQAKLDAKHKTKRITFNVVWKVAAAVVFVLLAVNQGRIYFAPEKENLAENNAEFSLSSVSPEYREVEFYFTNAISHGLTRWNSLKNDGLISENEQKAMNSELADFEDRYKTLQADLARNPNDERVINAMLQYYQAKLEIINMIVSKLQEVKQQKTNSNENNI